jgi:hypothetical protein
MGSDRKTNPETGGLETALGCHHASWPDGADAAAAAACSLVLVSQHWCDGRPQANLSQSYKQFRLAVCMRACW